MHISVFTEFKKKFNSEKQKCACPEHNIGRLKWGDFHYKKFQAKMGWDFPTAVFEAILHINFFCCELLNSSNVQQARKFPD